jgi:hypothetical protein
VLYIRVISPTDLICARGGGQGGVDFNWIPSLDQRCLTSTLSSRLLSSSLATGFRDSTLICAIVANYVESTLRVIKCETISTQHAFACSIFDNDVMISDVIKT